MNARELIQQWEREADGGANRTYYKCARDLRAALEEKPLARMWRKEADEFREQSKRYRLGGPEPDNETEHVQKYVIPSVLERCADALDASREEGRELLREAIEGIDSVSLSHTAALRRRRLKDRIRKHLGGDSDEA